MPIAEPVCVAHWRAEIRLFNCTFCNLPSHCLISSFKKTRLLIYYSPKRQDKYFIRKDNRCLVFKRSICCIKQHSDNLRQRAMNVATSMKNQKLRDISHTDRNDNYLHKCKPTHRCIRQRHK